MRIILKILRYCLYSYSIGDGKLPSSLFNHDLLLIRFSTWYVGSVSGRQGHALEGCGCLIYRLNSGDAVSSQSETRGLMSTVHPNPFSDVNGIWCLNIYSN